MVQERRDFERLALSSAIRYQEKGSQRFANSVGRDISNGGIGFISDEFFPISTNLVFEVRHPKTQEMIKAVGEVVWISNARHSENYNVGARFLGPPIPVS